ncbi:MAG: metal-dependent hydrolase [Herminiimonas sp.]|nr:metal-dependent hydrolase [Herminiimonas sp.]
MASTDAHRSTGWGIGLLAAALVSPHVHDPYHAWATLTALAAYAGATAPDWLEQSWWSLRSGKRLWITHRTWTHWGVAWIALLVVCHAHLGQYALAAPGFGFAAGGITHLLADWPNPLGVPWLLTKRYSLGWWKSGRCDALVVLAVWIAAIATADQVWWRGQVWHGTVFLAGKFLAALHGPLLLTFNGCACRFFWS